MPASPTPNIKWMRELIIDTINSILRTSPEKTAIVASGGVDSSTIAAIAANVRKPETLHVYHGTYHNEETTYVEALAQHADNIKLHIVRLDGDQFPEATEEIYKKCGPQFHPQGGTGIYSQLQVAKRIKKDGFKTMLSGEGGDEIFLGYPTFHLIPLKLNLATFRLVRHNLDYLGLSAHKLDYVRLLLSSLKDKFRRRKSLQPHLGVQEQFYNNRLAYAPESAINLFEPLIQQQLNAKAIRDSFFESIPAASEALDMMQQWFLTQELPALLDLDEAVATTPGLKLYSPLMNPEIIEHILSLPPEIRAPPAQLKPLLRKIAEPYLPSIILNRKDKKGFPTPYREWMKGPKLHYISRLLLGDESKLTSILDPHCIQDIIEDYEKGNNGVAFLLFQLTQIEYWLKAANREENKDNYMRGSV
jgi:asparagine synthase (glutamine-hydrolysing)